MTLSTKVLPVRYVQAEILRSIVRRIMILVMNNFSRTKRTTKNVFHHENVF
jgi:hypothetical protein